MATALAKPSTAATPYMTGDLGLTGTTFFIKSHQEQLQYASQAVDATGDGDESPHYENNGYLEGHINVQGFMLGSQAVGLKSVVDSGENPISFEIALASGNTQSVTLLVEQIEIGKQFKAAYIPVSITGTVTDTDPTTIEGTT